MNIYECEKLAQDQGYDSMEFLCVVNGRTLNCKWLDAYLGLLLIPEIGGGFVTKGTLLDIDRDLVCIPLEGSTGIFSI